MSKPISISFGKPKASLSGTNTPAPPTHKPRPAPQIASTKPKLLGHDEDDEDELKQPAHEAVTGFTANGAILGERVPEKEQVVIKNAGNSDWRKRRRAGKNLLPHEVQAPIGNTPVVEKDEVSKASGLQFAEKDARTTTAEGEPAGKINPNGADPQGPTRDRTEDEIALQALLQDGGHGSNSNAVIVQKANANLVRAEPVDELGDYRADVASRPDSATLEDYAAMPVEEFGLALIRGMGTKRKAHGQIANPGHVNDAAPKAREPRPGYLGIGAKAAPGAEVELGAWGKTAMRKGMNSKTGDGLYTPVMLKDKRTGEILTEEELQARKKEVKDRLNGKEEDWKERRDRNLEQRGRERNVLRTGMRETARLGAIEVVREIVGGEVMMVETRSIETEVGTETGKGGETSIAMMIAMIPALRERVTSGMEKGVVTTGMTGGEKSDIESDVCSMLICRFRIFTKPNIGFPQAMREADSHQWIPDSVPWKAAKSERRRRTRADHDDLRVLSQPIPLYFTLSSPNYVAVIDEQQKTLKISNQNEANAFPARTIPLETISNVYLADTSCSMLNTSATNPAPGRAPQMFIGFQHISDRSSFLNTRRRETSQVRELRVEDTRNTAFQRWKDNITEASAEELHDQLAIRKLEISSLQRQLADAHVGQENITAEPLGGYQLDDTLPFQISQVLKVLNGYDRYKKRREDIQEDLADAEDQIARQQSHIAALAVALISDHPDFITENELHKYLASSIGLLPGEIATLDDSADYGLAISRVFR